MAMGYSVSNDPREKLKKKMELDAIRAAMGGGQPNPAQDMQRGAPPPLSMDPEPLATPGMLKGITYQSGRERAWVPVLGPDKPTAPMARPAMGAPASTPPAGLMGPPTGDQAARDRIQQATVRSGILAKQMEYARAKGGDTRGLADERHALGVESDALGQSIRPITQPQTPAQVTEGRWGMHNQGTDIVGKQRQRAMEAEKAGDYETSRRLYADAERMEGAFKRDLSPYSGPEDPQVSGIIKRQGEAVPRQEAARSAWAGEANKLTDSNVATETRSREAMTAKMEQQRLQERLGQETTKGQIATATDLGNPQVRSAIRQAETARALTAAAKAQQEQRAVEGVNGQANPYAAQQFGEQRRAAYQMTGLDTPEQLHAFRAQALSAIEGLKHGAFGAYKDGDPEAVQAFASQTMPTLKRLYELHPETGRMFAREFLTALGGVHGSKTAAGIRGGVMFGPWGAASAVRNSGNSQEWVETLRKILEEYAAEGG